MDNYYDLSAYRKTISQAITYAHEKDFTYNIALIETTENAKRIEASKSPYYHCKSALMAANIPTQFVLSSNIKKTDYELQSILNAMALQMYAKIGGTPWVIPSNKGVDREIIVGVGHSIMRNNWYSGNTQSRFVAISTFFAGDGTYLLGAKSQDVAYEDYFEELFNSLKNSINSLSEKFAWEKGETVRIVFHLFKQVKNIEIEVIDKLMRSYTDFKLSYAFVTISSYHPFYLFDVSNKGIDRNGNIKGAFMPKRGIVQILDENSCLIQMKGSAELKTHKQRMTKPLLIRIHDKSTFKDLHFIVQQIYNFTYLSWKTFLPFEQPVSLYYSTLIANQLAKLRLIEKWNPDVINLNFKHKKWFL